jgi:hypothetical protein
MDPEFFGHRCPFMLLNQSRPATPPDRVAEPDIPELRSWTECWNVNCTKLISLDNGFVQ